MPFSIRHHSHPQVLFDLDTRILSPSEGNTNSVIIFIETKSHEIFEDPTTGSQTVTESNPTSPPLRIEFNLISSCPRDIRQLLRNHLTSLRWLSGYLAPRISTAAADIGFGRDGFIISVLISLTYRTVLVMAPLSEEEKKRESQMAIEMNLLVGGRIEGDDLNDLEMDTECSICLEKLLLGCCYPTRMSCSHVFHALCLWDWFDRENTCPLCRTVLYEVER